MSRLYREDSNIDDVVLTTSNAGKETGPRPRDGVSPMGADKTGISGELPGKAQPGGRSNGMVNGSATFNLPNAKGI